MNDKSNRAFLAWTEVYIKVLLADEVQIMWNLQKNVWVAYLKKIESL